MTNLVAGTTEPPQQLNGADILSRIPKLLDDPALFRAFIGRIAATGMHDFDALARAVSASWTASQYRKWAVQLARMNELVQIVIFFACVADYLKQALGCRRVCVHADATKVEIQTVHKSLIAHARKWYRETVLKGVPHPAWLAETATGPNAIRTRPEQGQRNPTSEYRAVRQALRVASDEYNGGDPLAAHVISPSAVADTYSRAIPILGLRAPAIVLGIALVSCVSPAHLKCSQPRKPKDSVVVFLYATAPESRPSIVHEVLDRLTEGAHLASTAPARKRSRRASDEDAGAAEIARYAAGSTPHDVVRERAAAAVKLADLKAAVTAIPAEQGPRGWDEFYAKVHLIGDSPWA
ncbi:hypothetical protein H9P43_006637 [Blastocladiella emersonii ATCC 22665]|nr:hypothetical protein H9P43_006637 [Blastocladiella emersonii ATCC 22665]